MILRLQPNYSIYLYFSFFLNIFIIFTFSSFFIFLHFSSSSFFLLFFFFFSFFPFFPFFHYFFESVFSTTLSQTCQHIHTVTYTSTRATCQKQRRKLGLTLTSARLPPGCQCGPLPTACGHHQWDWAVPHASRKQQTHCLVVCQVASTHPRH